MKWKYIEKEGHVKKRLLNYIILIENESTIFFKYLILLNEYLVHLFDNSFIILSGFWMSLLINETFSCFYRFDDHDPQV